VTAPVLDRRVANFTIIFSNPVVGIANSKAPPIGSLNRRWVPDASLFRALRFKILKFCAVPPTGSMALIPPARAVMVAPPVV
jgi:hypothetical protein